MIDPGRGCEPGTQAALWQITSGARSREEHRAMLWPYYVNLALGIWLVMSPFASVS
jgi:hypothetical protein